jgi:hypothetical protein
MRQVVQKRLEALGMETRQVITAQALDALVSRSGGIMRSLIRLMRAAVLRADEASKSRIDMDVAEHVLQADQRARSNALSPAAIRGLRTFEQTRCLPDDAREQISWLEEELVVAYIDKGLIWYDVHPGVLPLLAEG